MRTIRGVFGDPASQSSSLVVTAITMSDAAERLSQFLSSIVGVSENMPTSLTRHNDVYPAIDPQVHFDRRTYKDKVVLVTGASSGIGREVALHYAKAGAAVAIVARNAEALGGTSAAIVNAVGPNARVLTIRADVKVPSEAQDAVERTIQEFGGRLDVLVANAGIGVQYGKPLGEVDPLEWWESFEVNVLGVFNFVRYALAHLQKTNGYIITTSSGMAQLRYPTMSPYGISKLAVNRLVEFIDLEYPEVKTFAIHPGTIRTAINADAHQLPTPDTTALPAATILYLTAGNADWLHGRYISSNWDMYELEKDWKEKILAQGSLVTKLAIPS